MPEKGKQFHPKNEEKQAGRGFFRFHVLEAMLSASAPLTISQLRAVLLQRGFLFSWLSIQQAVGEIGQILSEHYELTTSTQREGRGVPTRAYRLTINKTAP
jgi:hypothetical protein